MRLIESPFDNKGFVLKKKKAGTIREFEKYLGFSDKSKEFREWFRDLLDRDIIYCSGEESRGNGQIVSVYSVNKKKLWNEKFMKNPDYNFSVRFWTKRATFTNVISESP